MCIFDADNNSSPFYAPRTVDKIFEAKLVTTDVMIEMFEALVKDSNDTSFRVNVRIADGDHKEIVDYFKDKYFEGKDVYVFTHKIYDMNYKESMVMGTVMVAMNKK